MSILGAGTAAAGGLGGGVVVRRSIRQSVLVPQAVESWAWRRGSGVRDTRRSPLCRTRPGTPAQRPAAGSLGAVHSGSGSLQLPVRAVAGLHIPPSASSTALARPLAIDACPTAAPGTASLAAPGASCCPRDPFSGRALPLPAVSDAAGLKSVRTAGALLGWPRKRRNAARHVTRDGIRCVSACVSSAAQLDASHPSHAVQHAQLPPIARRKLHRAPPCAIPPPSRAGTCAAPSTAAAERAGELQPALSSPIARSPRLGRCAGAGRSLLPASFPHHDDACALGQSLRRQAQPSPSVARQPKASHFFPLLSSRAAGAKPEPRQHDGRVPPEAGLRRSTYFLPLQGPLLPLLLQHTTPPPLPIHSLFH